jgi:hypothetical protein
MVNFKRTVFVTTITANQTIAVKHKEPQILPFPSTDIHPAPVPRSTRTLPSLPFLLAFVHYFHDYRHLFRRHPSGHHASVFRWLHGLKPS